MSVESENIYKEALAPFIHSLRAKASIYNHSWTIITEWPHSLPDGSTELLTMAVGALKKTLCSDFMKILHETLKEIQLNEPCPDETILAFLPIMGKDNKIQRIMPGSTFIPAHPEDDTMQMVQEIRNTLMRHEIPHLIVVEFLREFKNKPKEHYLYCTSANDWDNCDAVEELGLMFRIPPYDLYNVEDFTFQLDLVAGPSPDQNEFRNRILSIYMQEDFNGDTNEMEQEEEGNDQEYNAEGDVMQISEEDEDDIDDLF